MKSGVLCRSVESKGEAHLSTRADERHAREGWGFARVPSLATFYENVTFGAFQESDAASGDDVAAYASLTPGSVVWGRVIDNREPSAIKVEILRVVACDA